MISYAQEPYVHAIESGATLTYNGYDIMADTLMEVKAVQRDAATAREAIRRVGKPGMHIGDCATGMTAIGKMAASEPVNLLRPCDGRLVAQMCELKTNDDQLIRVPHLLNYGSHIINLMTPLTGGIGGGPAGRGGGLRGRDAAGCGMLFCHLSLPEHHPHQVDQQLRSVGYVRAGDDRPGDGAQLAHRLDR